MKEYTDTDTVAKLELNSLYGKLVRHEGLNFGEAVEALKIGSRVARFGWNGKGMWLALVRSDNYVIMQAPHGDGQDTEYGECKGLLPWIGMKTADDKFVPWLASQTDILAEDWAIVLN